MGHYANKCDATTTTEGVELPAVETQLFMEGVAASIEERFIPDIDIEGDGVAEVTDFVFVNVSEAETNEDCTSEMGFAFVTMHEVNERRVLIKGDDGTARLIQPSLDLKFGPFSMDLSNEYECTICNRHGPLGSLCPNCEDQGGVFTEKTWPGYCRVCQWSGLIGEECINECMVRMKYVPTDDLSCVCDMCGDKHTGNLGGECYQCHEGLYAETKVGRMVLRTAWSNDIAPGTRVIGEFGANHGRPGDPSCDSR
jgi:hypothetical protein